MLHFQKWKLILVFGIVLAGFIFAIPNLFPSSSLQGLPSWFPHKQVNLGLDLQGGAHLLYRIDEKELIDDWLGTIRGDVRESLRSNRIGYTDLAQNVAGRSVSVRVRKPEDEDKAFTELKKQSVPVGGDVFGGFSGNNLDVSRDGDKITLTVTEVGSASSWSGSVSLAWATVTTMGYTPISSMMSPWTGSLSADRSSSVPTWVPSAGSGTVAASAEAGVRVGTRMVTTPAGSTKKSIAGRASKLETTGPGSSSSSSIESTGSWRAISMLMSDGSRPPTPRRMENTSSGPITAE